MTGRLAEDTLAPVDLAWMEIEVTSDAADRVRRHHVLLLLVVLIPLVVLAGAFLGFVVAAGLT